ncbi:MAG: HD domain-containing protein [Saccharofermentanales bacterium]
MEVYPRIIREKQEENLSPFAIQSRNSLGRKIPIEKCRVRTEFERDTGRILFSHEFRRLRHKTQVFFNPQNDHICTRMEHVLYVNYISNTIARTLNLNPDLVNAISLGHDLGHPPFGHSGEKMLDECIKKVDSKFRFQHELHSLRVADRLAVSKEHPGRLGYNLTFEVRDGIVSHCGETYDEILLVPDRAKRPAELEDPGSTLRMPATLEGCVVRFADKIAYVGRDVEDAVRAGIMEFEDIPRSVQSELGSTNGEIINTLVTDIISNSISDDRIALSSEKGEAMKSLLLDNVSRIYRSEKIKAYEKMAKLTVEGLFNALLTASSDPEKMRASRVKVYRMFSDYIDERQYGAGEPDVRKVVDFIAGMSDSFAQTCYEEIFWI